MVAPIISKLSLSRIGERFGRLVVVEWAPGHKKTQMFLCQCDCGTQKYISHHSLRRGTISCGCYQREAFGNQVRTHGMVKNPAYSPWENMKNRCHNPRAENWSHYGGRGIKVCERWINSFENFLSDMGPRPPKTSLDRIDNNLGYSKENCRWATRVQQMRNRRTSRTIEFNGKSQCIAAWEQELGFSPHVVHFRLKTGWTIEEALTTPQKIKIQKNSR